MAREPDAWSAPYRVRFDEAGPDGCVRTSVLLRYDARGAPTRIPAEFEPVFGASTGGLALARVDLPAAPADASERQFSVRLQELDPMGHVNNAVYADWLEETVAEATADPVTRVVPRLARLEYAAPADPGARLTALCWPADAGWSYRLRDATGAELLRARLETIHPAAEPS